MGKCHIALLEWKTNYTDASHSYLCILVILNLVFK